MLLGPGARASTWIWGEGLFSLCRRGNFKRFTKIINCVAATFHFGIVDGNLCAGVTYSGYSNMFTDAKLTLSFEKKYMLFFWKTVEIGYPDEKWTGYCYDLDGSIYQEFPCPGSGTYRANFKFEVYGRYSSVVDVIEDYVQREC